MIDEEQHLKNLEIFYTNVTNAINALTSDEIRTKKYKLDTGQTSQEVDYRDLSMLITLRRSLWQEINQIRHSINSGGAWSSV